MTDAVSQSSGPVGVVSGPARLFQGFLCLGRTLPAVAGVHLLDNERTIAFYEEVERRADAFTI